MTRTNAHLARFAARLRRQEGVAMVVAAGVLMVIGILSAVVAAASINQREQSQEDRSSKRAIAAADAGLKRAIRQLNVAQPDDEQCVGTGAAAAPTVGIFCKGHGYLGRGAAYDYYVSQLIRDATARPSTGGCVGNDQSFTPGTRVISLDQRCIVAVGCVQPTVTDPNVECVDDTSGTVRGVHRRVQARTGAMSEALFFPGGLYGNDRLCVGANYNFATRNCNLLGAGTHPVVDSDVGSNILVGIADGGNAVEVCNLLEPGTRAQILLARGGTVHPDGDQDFSDNRCQQPGASNGLIPELVRVPGFGDTPDVERALRGCFLGETAEPCTTVDPAKDTSVQNNNAAMAATLPACAVYRQIETPVDNPATPPGDRELDLRACANGTTVTLPAGNYNFCRLWIDNENLVPFAGAQPSGPLTPFSNPNSVRIFIDSPYRAGSGCGKGNQRADGVVGTSDTLGDRGTTWDYNNDRNCDGQVNTPSDYRCADGSIRYSNGVAVVGGQVNESLRFQFWVYGNPIVANNNGTNTCRPYAAQGIPLTMGGYVLPCPAINNGVVAPGVDHPIDFRNQANLTFAVFAPNSTFQIQNSGSSTQITVNGAVRAENIIIGNGLVFTQDPNTRDISLSIDERLYYRGPWTECRPDPTSATDPRGGC